MGYRKKTYNPTTVGAIKTTAQSQFLNFLFIFKYLIQSQNFKFGKTPLLEIKYNVFLKIATGI
jgi:hypothetical protein